MNTHNTLPAAHNDYRPMHAESVDTAADPLHYQRMVEITDAIVEGDTQAVHDAAVADKANYVALVDVCRDTSRNPAAPDVAHQASAYILDTPILRAGKYADVQPKTLFNYDTYMEENRKPAGERSKSDTYNRDPEVANQINDEFDSIRFYTHYLASNPRYGEFARKYAKFEASIPQDMDPQKRSALIEERLKADPELQKWRDGANRYQQEMAERILPHIHRLAEIVEGNRDYGVLAGKKLEEMFGQEVIKLHALDAARNSHEKQTATYREAAERRDLTGHAARLYDVKTHEATLRAGQASANVAAAEQQLRTARAQKVDKNTIAVLEDQLESARYQAAAAQHDLATAAKTAKTFQYDTLTLGALQGRERAAADAARGNIRKADIAANAVTTFTEVMRQHIERGELRLSYEITPQERAEHERHKQLLETMVREAVQMQRANNTIEQEHELFVTRTHLQAYIAYIENRLQEADPDKHDPRFPELHARYNDMVNLEGRLLYSTAAQRLQRAQTRNAQQPDFDGRAAVTPVDNQGLLIHDGANYILYPDGSRAYVQDNGTVSARIFAGKQYTPSPRTASPLQQPETGASADPKQRSAGLLGKLSLRRRR